MEEGYLIYNQMQELKNDIADTIKMPIFFLDLNSVYRDEIIALAYKILDLHYKGVTDEFLQDRVINRTLRRIEDISMRLKELAEPDINLICWMWINEVVTKWIDFAIMYQEFETATNLRKIINFEYA
jgi:hypothetical protein